MYIGRQGICLWAVALFSLAGVCHAQSAVTPEDEYKKLIRVSEEIQPLGENPFGEQASLYNGSLSFEQTDVSLAGNGPVLQLSRSYHPKDATDSELTDGAFSDWDIEIPRITTMTANQGGVNGWQINQPNRDARCTLFGIPPTVALQQGGADWVPSTWWSGYQLIVPGSGSQDLLKRTSQNTLSPDMNGTTFPIVTKQNWMISCLPTTDGSGSGEAFLAISPDGTKYWFNHLVYRWAPTMRRSIGTGPLGFRSSGVGPMVAPDDFLRRRQASMLVTRVEDRFGNSLTYSYSGDQITSITASDGRQVSMGYVTGTNLIGTVSVTSASGSARTWSYQYAAAQLTKVTLPDGSAWSFNLAGLHSGAIVDGEGACDGSAALSSNILSGSIVHPSGLVGAFQVKPTVRGRSYVPRQCVLIANGMGSYAYVPRVYYQLSLLQKTFSGAEISAKTWRYNFSPSNESWAEDCVGGCVTTVWTDVVDPAGRAIRYTFSNRYDITEGQLLRTDYYVGAVGTSMLRSEINAYAAPTGGPWPALYGDNLQSRINWEVVGTRAPLTQRTVQQEGDTYTWQAELFDEFAQVTQTKRYAAFGGQEQPGIREETTYLNDLPHWVLGLPLTVKNLTTGEVVSENEYDLSSVTPSKRYRFGQPLMSYAFNSAGQLASFTDGNHHTTSLSNYKRGIPQAIGFPDGTSQSLTVDDFGQITSITDQAGSTTSYNYDGVGRLTQISYPSGDEQTWLPKTFAYDYVPSAERGLAAGHWRRTISKGDARAVTYFDALLRPVLSDSYISGVAGSTTSALTNYDPKGQKTFASYPNATPLSFTTDPATALIKGIYSHFDALGRLVQARQDAEQGLLTTTTAYLSGARQQVTDPKGQVTTTSYQVFDQPSYDAVIKVEAPENVTQVIVRDLYGNPLSIRQSGLYATQSMDVTKTLIYDAYRRLCRTSEPESGSTVMGYDDANNLVWSVAGATLSDDDSCHPELVQSVGVTTRSYDAMNRVWKLTPPAPTQGTIYTYDALGNMASAVSGISTWAASRNKRGQLTGESLQLTGQSAWAIGYAHDAYGSVSLIHYPDGENVSYGPDALGRPTQVGSYANGLKYYPNGEVKEFDYGNGAVYAADQNTRQLVRNFSYGQGATPVISEDYTYDANGNITKVDDLAGGPRTKEFGYDALNRLSSAQATGLWGTESYTYDPLNNIRTRVTGGQTLTYHYNTLNQLDSISGGAGSTFVYDNRGNVIAKNGANLEFDQKNQLTQIPGYGSYAYDAAGRRVMKTPAGGGAPTYYFYNQGGQLLHQVDTGTAKATNFVYLGRKLLARNENVQLMAPGAISFDANPNDGVYTVSWPPVIGASLYTVQQSANGGGWTAAYSGSATSTALSGMAGGSYVYRVQACAGGSTCTDWTTSATLGVRPALPTVTVPSGTINGTYTVSWTAPASTTGYDVQERLNGGSWTTIASNTAATSISRPGTTSGSYTYQVSATNAHGSRGWAGSGAVTVDTTYGVVPTAPASLTVPASSSTGSATLNWSPSSLTTSYVVEQSANGGVSWTGIYSSNGTSTAVSGLADGSYIFHVQACNTYGCSPWAVGNATLVVTHPPTTAPTVSVPANSTNGSYTVSWSGIAGPVSYTLQEQVNGGGWATVQTNGLTSWSTSGRGNGAYGYHVQACNVGGCGPWSAVASTTVLLPLVSPASISVPATSNGPIAISWAASATATSYGLEQSANGGGWVQVYGGAATSTPLSAGASGSYSYRVMACNASGCTGYATSSAVTVTIAPASAPSLSVPSTSNSGSYTVNWGGVSGATSYTLQEQVNGGGWTAVQANGNTSWSASGKANGSYGYRVQACNVGGCGPWSTAGTVTVALAPDAPGNVHWVYKRIGNKFDSLTIVWNAVSGATYYEVRCDSGLCESDYSNWPPGSTTVNVDTATSYTAEGNSVPFEFHPVPDFSYSVRACSPSACSAWAPVGGAS